MELTVLGSASPYARPGNPCSGYLVRHGGTALWLDAIWLSHLHADHAADLLTAYYALLYADLEPPGPRCCSARPTWRRRPRARRSTSRRSRPARPRRRAAPGTCC
ncbi:hypothetical protein ACFQXA_24170 [Nocardiopsis composta]